MKVCRWRRSAGRQGLTRRPISTRRKNTRERCRRRWRSWRTRTRDWKRSSRTWHWTVRCCRMLFGESSKACSQVRGGEGYVRGLGNLDPACRSGRSGTSHSRHLRDPCAIRISPRVCAVGTQGLEHQYQENLTHLQGLGSSTAQQDAEA